MERRERQRRDPSLPSIPEEEEQIPDPFLEGDPSARSTPNPPEAPIEPVEGSGWFGFRRCRDAVRYLRDEARQRAEQVVQQSVQAFDSMVQVQQQRVSQAVNTAVEQYERVRWMVPSVPGPQESPIPRGRPLPQEDLDYLQREHRIEFQDQIGRGAFAYVWRASVEITDNSGNTSRRVYACKILSLASFTPVYRIQNRMWLNVAVDRITKEAAVYESLAHPNIMRSEKMVRLYHRTGATYPTRVLVFMEVMDGDLQQLSYRLTGSNVLNETQALNCLAPIAFAMRYLHVERRIAHLDIKPDNILYKRMGDLVIVRLADFGMFKEFDENERSTDRHGTAIYAAPESLNTRGQAYNGEYDAFPIDVYMLGIALAAIHIGLGTNATIARGPPESINSLIRLMLEPDPIRRVNISAVCEHPLISQRNAIVGEYFDINRTF